MRSIPASRGVSFSNRLKNRRMGFQPVLEGGYPACRIDSSVLKRALDHPAVGE